jgi:hypothetical protein
MPGRTAEHYAIIRPALLEFGDSHLPTPNKPKKKPPQRMNAAAAWKKF